MKPTSHTFGLSRRTTGLSEAHKQLIKLLAAKAVENFLHETDAAETADEADRNE